MLSGPLELFLISRRMNTSTATKDNALTFLLARSVRIAKEEERRHQEAELAKQEELRKCLAYQSC